MSEQLKSTIRQILIYAAGVGPVASLLIWVGIDPMKWPVIVDWLLAFGGIVASGWAIMTRSKKAIVSQAAAIVPVPAVSQAKAGITILVAPKV